MASIRCPHCGAPVMLRGSRWECGYCGDFGSTASLQPSERAKLAQACAPSVRITVTVTEEEAPPSPACAEPEAEEAPRFSRAELEDMIRTQHGAEIHCQFCNRFHRFSEEDLRALLQQAR